MRRRKADEGPSFEALRHAIEHCDLELMLGFYAEEAELSIVNACVSQTSPSELREKAEVAKHLPATFGQRTSHRVGREVVDEEQATFQEPCEYPDVSRLLVRTTLAGARRQGRAPDGLGSRGCTDGRNPTRSSSRF